MHKKVLKRRSMGNNGCRKWFNSIKITKKCNNRILPHRLRSINVGIKLNSKLYQTQPTIIFRHVFIRLQHPGNKKLLRPAPSRLGPYKIPIRSSKQLDKYKNDIRNKRSRKLQTWFNLRSPYINTKVIFIQYQT